MRQWKTNQRSLTIPDQLLNFHHPRFRGVAPPQQRKKKTANVMQMLTGNQTQQLTTDDFAAAFLHAGISVHKLDHLSIRGLIQK